ncbi:MAG TPA: L,D-transpeptidase [Jatrophihabitans sp.]|nr:L,D-transpeptidase [Jatrophihabitans sp.]
MSRRSAAKTMSGAGWSGPGDWLPICEKSIGKFRVRGRVTYRSGVQNPLRLRSSRVTLGLLAATAFLLSACASAGEPATKTVTKTTGAGSSTASSAASSGSAKASPKPIPTKPVHIKLFNEDGSRYGVGMPVIAFFNKKITSAKPLQDATTVTVNGKPAKGAWYFEYSQYLKGYPIEAHFRLQTYWPAHSRIHVSIPAKGLSAGRGLTFDDSLTSDFTTGPANIAVVNNITHEMTVTTDGHFYGRFPVSLGASNTPTARGTKVIMEKGRSICMSGPGYNECGVKYTQRLTYGGEYLHSAPWNISNIRRGINSSNGCTNLLPSDAQRLYGFLRIGDVVQYPNADGPEMSLGAGYGDWNIDWGTWQTGGLVSTV